MIRHPEAARAAALGAHGGHAAQNTLISLLECAFGIPEPALVALHQALSAAGLATLPASPLEVLEFAREHLLPLVADQLGARAAIAFLGSATSRLDPRESDVPPSARRPIARVRVGSSVAPEPCVLANEGPVAQSPVASTRGVWLIVEQDSLARASLARSLVQCRLGVRVVDTVDDLAVVLGSGEIIDAAVLDVQHSSAGALVDILAKERPDLAIVARACDERAVHEALARMGIRRFGVCARHATAVDLLAMIRRLTA